MNILILGITGKIGKLVFKLLPKEKNLQFFFTHRDIKPKFLNRENVFKCDLGCSAQVELFSRSLEGRIDVVISMTGIKATNVKDYNQNIKLAHSIDKLTTGLGAKKLIYFSSSAVYGKGQSHIENGQTKPIGYYGLSKKKSEDILLKKSIGKYCLNILRVANVAGADALLSQMRFNRKIVESIKIEVFRNDRGAIRNYIDPVTLVEILIALSKTRKKIPHLLNVGSLKPVDMKELVRVSVFDWIAVSPEISSTQKITINSKKLADLFPQISLDLSAESIVRRLKALEFI